MVSVCSWDRPLPAGLFGTSNEFFFDRAMEFLAEEISVAFRFSKGVLRKINDEIATLVLILPNIENY